MSLRLPIPELEPIADRTLTAVLRRNLRERADEVAVLDPDRELTFRQLWDLGLLRAGGFGSVGVRGGTEDGDVVVLMLDNHVDFIATWVSLSLVGAVEVPVNTAYRGAILVHVLNDCGARVAVVESGYLDRLVDAHEKLQRLEHVFVRGHVGELPDVPGWRLHHFDDLDRSAPAEPAEVKAWTQIGLMYTSGTTGNSKGVRAPHGLAHSYSSIPWIHPGERIMVNLPLFHIGGQWAGVYAAWIAGGSAVVIPRFSASTFLDDVRRYRCDQTLILGAMASFLWAQPRRADDADTPLTKVSMAPIVANQREFAERFGVEICCAYGLTEFSSPILTHYGEGEPGMVGTLRDDFEARIVDEHDVDVETGQVGELLLRAKVSWANMDGYHGLPVVTQRAWRNLWFHTGDAMRRDERGRFHFVDRISDALRVRGENVSSFEVEGQILEHDAVVGCAVVAVGSEHTEDDIKAVVVLDQGARLEPAELLEFLVERLPYFMVPRYIEVLEDLPVTPTQKVRKAQLRSSGVTAGTWDREAHGYRVTRNGLQRPTPVR